MKTTSITKSQLRVSNSQLTDGARLDLGFALLVGCASGIATMGFAMNSPAVIVGSMVVSPLLYVLIGITAAAFRQDWSSMRVCITSLAVGIVVALSVATMVAAISPVSEQSEIANRLNTKWEYYFVVALISGFAGAVAFYWPGTQEALPGIAIAVALVPPLSMTGIGISSVDTRFALESAGIATVNTIAILVGALIAVALLHGIAGETPLEGKSASAPTDARA